MVLIILANILGAVILGILLLMAVYSMPVENIQENVSRSANLIEAEGAYPILYSWCTSQLDNWTDSVILQEAATDLDTTLLDKAMNIYRGINGEEPVPALVDHYLYGLDYTDYYPYTRYWHGFLIIIKPLLEFLSLGGIRIINGIAQTVLTIIVCIILSRKKLYSYIILVLLNYFYLMPVALAKSFQYSPCYYAGLLGMLALLLMKESSLRTHGALIFLNIGIFIAYFDFLSYPMAAFGMPIVLYIGLIYRESLETRIGRMLQCSLFWLIGYIGMCSAKWLSASILAGYDLSDATSEVSSVTSIKYLPYSRTEILINNYKTFAYTPFLLIALIIIIYFIILNGRCKLSHNNIANIIFPYMLIGLTPIIWHMISVYQSAISLPISYRNCLPTLLAVLFAMTDRSWNEFSLKDARII